MLFNTRYRIPESLLFVNSIFSRVLGFFVKKGEQQDKEAKISFFTCQLI
ncbi:hypothetical protein RV03_GL001328 [Enterococcus gallinarum]|nr:hypothetical protein RV03_GL001328 [Enterococcus gallinarum]